MKLDSATALGDQHHQLVPSTDQYFAETGLEEYPAASIIKVMDAALNSHTTLAEEAGVTRKDRAGGDRCPTIHQG